MSGAKNGHQARRAWAEQIQNLPPAVQNREADLLVRCPKRALLVRVFRRPKGGVLVLPVGRWWMPGGAWCGPDYWWHPADGRDAVMSARCRCCANPHQLTRKEMWAGLYSGRRTITLRAIR